MFAALVLFCRGFIDDAQSWWPVPFFLGFLCSGSSLAVWETRRAFGFFGYAQNDSFEICGGLEE